MILWIDGSGFIKEVKNYEEWRDRLVLGEREKHRVIYKSEVLEEDVTISGCVRRVRLSIGRLRGST